MISSLPAGQMPIPADWREAAEDAAVRPKRTRRRSRSGAPRRETRSKAGRSAQRAAHPASAKAFTGFLLAVVVIGLMATATVARYAELAQFGYRLNQLQAERDQLQAENLALASKVASLSDLKRIEQVARTELGMVDPPQYQPIEIQVDERAVPTAAAVSGNSTRLALAEPSTGPTALAAAASAVDGSWRSGMAGFRDLIFDWFAGGNRAQARTAGDLR